MFPNHQRRERSSRQEPHQGATQQFDSPQQHHPQQQQQQYPTQYPPNTQPFSSPQQYPPQGYPQAQHGYPETQSSNDSHLQQPIPDTQHLAFDSSSHSSHHSHNSQTYPPPPQQQQQHQHQYPPQQQQHYPQQPQQFQHPQQHEPEHDQSAPYPKWTPPNVMSPSMQQQPPLQQPPLQQPHQQPQQHQHQQLQQQQQYPPTIPSEYPSSSETQPPQSPPQALTDPSIMTETAVAGQKDYEWKPPAALQAFQTTPSPTEQPQPQSQMETEQAPVVTQDPVSTPFVPPVPEQDQQQQEEEEDSSGFTNFLSWAKLEDPSDVSEFLFNDPRIGIVTDAHGNTFLHGACDVGNISMVQFFLKHFPVDSASSLQASNNQGFEPIHMAAFGGMLHVVGLLLKFDPSLATRRTRSGSTMLHLAVANSNFQLVDFLLDSLDDETIWTVNSGGSNALHLACKFGNVAMIDRFAKLPGADVNFRNAVDDTTCAGLVCHNFDETMHVLVSNGAKLESKCAVDLLGPKMKKLFPVTKSSSRVLASRSSDSVEHGVDHKGSPYSSKNLRKSQGGVSLVDHEGLPPDTENSELMSSPTTRRKSSSYFPPSNASFLPPKDDSSSSKSKVVVTKQNQGSSKTKKSKKISNPNSWIKSKHSEDDGEIVKVSSAFEKDVSTSSVSKDDDEDEEEGETAVEETEDTDTDRGAGTDAQLFQFVEESKIPELEAVLGVFPSIVRDVNAIRNSVDETSLLHSAARSGSLDVAQYLVEGVGSNVNALDSNKQSPLHYAVEATQLILVRYLVKYCGVLLDLKDANGKVALELLPSASSEDRDEIERIMQKAAKKSCDKRLKVTIPKFSSA